MVLSPLMVERTFGNEVWRLTANEIIWTIGSLVGGVFIAFRKQIKNKVFAIAVCFVAFGVTFGFMSIATNFVTYLILILISGFLCLYLLLHKPYMYRKLQSQMY